MGGAHGQAAEACSADQTGGDEFGRRALGRREMAVADAFADRRDDALVADHGSYPETKYAEYAGSASKRSAMAVASFTAAEGMQPLTEFVEVETGNGCDALDRRPQLAAALAHARTAKCPWSWPSSTGCRATCTSSRG